MREIIENKSFDLERSLYNQKDSDIINCNFAGPNDGESVLKECRECHINNCSFSLRYPLWHAVGFELINSKLDELTRASIWYATKGLIRNCTINGIKCLRECKDIEVADSVVDSKEFGWKCNNLKISNSVINSEYFLFETDNVVIKKLSLTGKYSFQYMENVVIEDSNLDTKDAFWHSKNLVVRNSIVKGEYLGWFSDGLTLINCTIIGTQPLCYCKNLKLVNCTMENTDLSFEYSNVEATVKGNILSVKNPKSGKIYCDSVGEVIHDHTVMDCKGEVIVLDK